MPSRPGIVDLRDLGHRYAWDPRAVARFLAEAKLSPAGEARHRLAPPPVVIVIGSIDEPERFLRHRAWLGDAAHVLLVLEPGEAPGELAAEWPRDPAVEIFDWSEIEVALVRARQLAETCELRPTPLAPPPLVHASGPAFDLAPVAPNWLDPMTLLARQLTADARLHASGGLVSLHSPPATVDIVPPDHHAAPTPDGGQLRSLGGTGWRIDDDQVFEAPGRIALGFDAFHPVGWTGHRMMTFWLYRGSRGVGFFSACDHDFPCGPAKKLYGYSDNEPRRIELAGDLSAVAYHFERDVTFSSVLPVGWRAAGDFDVADFPHDETRAVFFLHEGGTQAFTEDLLDEDARDAAPAFVLAAGGEAAYAVDLGRPVIRVTPTTPGEGQATPLPTLAGYAVFDRRHRELRRGAGRLLGGAGGHALISQAGRLRRENLATGAIVPLPGVEGEPLYALPVPGSVNVLLVSAEGERLSARLL